MRQYPIEKAKLSCAMMALRDDASEARGTSDIQSAYIPASISTKEIRLADMDALFYSAGMQSESNLECPSCGYVERIKMSIDYCQFFMNANRARN